ncbi:MAG: class I SAM-dependent methyltransferase [Desulfobacteraceae bacterium]|nr:MAG: class I SAM-dependent methyltransferase [Desulfobacteraceae bacterium]
MDSIIEAHYHSDNLCTTILDALETAGRNTSQLALKDLAAVDQLHTGGFLSTMELVKAAAIAPDSRILDAGCGIGGSSRLMVEEFSCQVSGIDLSHEFIHTARELTHRCSLADRIQYEQGSVLDLAFPDSCFDALLSQHLLMNIEDQAGAFKEFFRVLRSGGKLLIHEIFTAGPGITAQDIEYPVPWASHAGLSFLNTWEETRSQLDKAGFTLGFQQDQSPSAIDWWSRVKAAHGNPDTPRRPLGPHLVFGDDGARFGATMLSNFEGGQLKLMGAVFTKP